MADSGRCPVFTDGKLNEVEIRRRIRIGISRPYQMHDVTAVARELTYVVYTLSVVVAHTATQSSR